MKKKLQSILQYVLFLGLGVFLIWLTTRNLDEEQITQLKTSLERAHYWVLLPVLAMLLFSHWSRAVRWKLLIEPLGYSPRTSNTFFAVMVGYLANLAVPRLGEVLKCTLLARYEKVPADKLIGTIVAERAFDLVCLMLVFTLTILTQIDTIGSFAEEQFRNIFSPGKSSSSFPGWLAPVILLVVLFLAWLLLKRFSHHPFMQKGKAILKGIWQGLTSIRRVRKKGWFLFHTLFIWFMYLMSIRIGFYAMGVTASFGIPEALSILSFGSIAMIITQGGIGAYQFLIQKIMIVYGLDAVEGLAFGWLLWSAQTIILLVGGIICLGLLPRYNRKPVSAPAPVPETGNQQV